MMMPLRRFMGLKELFLPEIQYRNPKFQIVLDNGLHRLTTDFMPIDSSYVPINKEFELIVGEQLDLIVTLKLSCDKLRDRTVQVSEKKKVKSKNPFARCFGIKETYITTKYVNKPPEFDPLSHLLANDGSFAKFHINFDDFKNDICCVSKMFKINGLNEWKVYKDVGSDEMLRANPYKICAIDFKMMFIPRTSQYEILPISIKNATEQINQIGDISNLI
ncbi:unnamed protein product [Ambrosiozyma monospora]|uniref:Unnamed protein product n=1 Tax=Ambrosiozyma monospora TaxID=43982 RepID=A0ACB5TZS7_AMBMO|nr:unnamed protein product [Ambrosiozyma monospora]